MLTAFLPYRAVARLCTFVGALPMILAIALCGAASAQDASTETAASMSAPLRKSEVEAFVGAGKKVTYLRKRDGSKSTWDFSNAEDVFYSTTTSQRNVRVSGTYRVTGDGAVCFKWNQDKYISLQDGCSRFRREGDVLHVVGHNDPDRIVGDVVAD